MPIYTLNCSRCEHSSGQGFTVAGFKAQEQQGFLFLHCPRCKRRGTLSHDFMADARSQVVHKDEYTFAENAPEDHLVNKTVTKAEAKAILKKHGLVEAGVEAKRRTAPHTRTYTEEEIKARWAAERALRTDKPTENNYVAVDTDVVETDTIVAKTWPALKAQAKSLGIKAPSTTKRPELERLVREQLNP